MLSALVPCGCGFGMFESLHSRPWVGGAPADRAGAGSGMLSSSRVVGQTTGSALVAVVLGLTHGEPNSIVHATHIALGLAAVFGGLAMGLS